MRKALILCFAALALLTGACGGGDDKKDNASDVANNASGALSKLAASQVTDVCGGREAVNMGLAFQSAMTNSGNVNYDDVAEALDRAADAAPDEIKDDWRVLADAEGPFLKVIGEADMSNYMALAQNPEFQAAMAKLDTEEFRTASANVNAWFADNCK